MIIKIINISNKWPKRIKDVFITRKVNQYGIYCVKINYFGEW